MGSGVSAENKVEMTNLINISNSTTGRTCSNALEKIWELLKKGEDYKLALFDDSLQLVSICNRILHNENNKYDSSNIKFALRIITSFSTLHQLKSKLANEPNVNENVMKYAKDNDNITKSNSQTYFRNLLTMEESSIIIQNMSTPFIYAYASNLTSNDYELKHATFILCRNICNFLQPHFLEHLIKSDVISINLKTLKTYGTNPNNWEQRNEIPSSILYFLLNLSFYNEGSEAIKTYDGSVEFIEKLIHTDGGESLIAALIISALIGKDESNKQKASLLQAHPKLTISLMDSFQAALDGGVGAAYTKLNNQWGYNWNFFSLHLIVGAIRNLSLSDSNKSVLIATKSLLPMLIKTLTKYINNDPQISKILESGIDNKIGGGGGDHRSAMIVLETLVSLSYYYEGNQELKDKYMLPSLGMESLLEKLLALPSDRKVPDQSKRYASILLKRISSKAIIVEETINPTTTTTTTNVTTSPNSKVDSIRSAASSNSIPKKHIMISYAWAANKPYVLKLTKALRQIGYDVWRDEEGSTIVPKLAGDIEASLAAAIDHAHVVIICISKQYKESINCRSEAQYCKLKNKKVLYVMMNENYHTRSSPESLDGWLAFMLGGDLWYPLWNENAISTTVQELTNLIGLEYNMNQEYQNDKDIIINQPTTQTSTNSTITNPTSPLVNVSAIIDYEKAWSVIKDSLHVSALQEFLQDLGVDAAQYLEGLEQSELNVIASHLPTAKKRLFNKAMNLN